MHGIWVVRDDMELVLVCKGLVLVCMELVLVCMGLVLVCMGLVYNLGIVLLLYIPLELGIHCNDLQHNLLSVIFHQAEQLCRILALNLHLMSLCVRSLHLNNRLLHRSRMRKVSLSKNLRRVFIIY